MGVVALCVERMFVVGNVLCGESAHILAAAQVAFCPIGVEVEQGAGVEMHIVAHLIERYLQGVLRVSTVNYAVLQHKKGALYGGMLCILHPQSADVVIEYLGAVLRLYGQYAA